MAHPLGKWNIDVTSSVLDELPVEIGFLAHNDGTSQSVALNDVGVPRVDNSDVIRTIRACRTDQGRTG